MEGEKGCRKLQHHSPPLPKRAYTCTHTIIIKPQRIKNKAAEGSGGVFPSVAPAQGRGTFQYGHEMDALLGLRGPPRSQARDGLGGTSRTAGAADVGAPGGLWGMGASPLRECKPRLPISGAGGVGHFHHVMRGLFKEARQPGATVLSASTPPLSHRAPWRTPLSAPGS